MQWLRQNQYLYRVDCGSPGLTTTPGLTWAQFKSLEPQISSTQLKLTTQLNGCQQSELILLELINLSQVGLH